MPRDEIAPAPCPRRTGRGCLAGQRGNPSIPKTGNKSQRESADDYRGEILRCHGWRVAVCKDNWQWLLQRITRTGSPNGPRWVSESFCRTRAALVHLWQEATGDDGLQLLERLPEHFNERG